MSLIKVLSACAVIGLTGCSSIVITYDATGKVIGSCKATRGLLSTAGAHCSGSGNATGIDYSKTDAAGTLPTPPVHTQIILN